MPVVGPCGFRLGGIELMESRVVEYWRREFVHQRVGLGA
jgi:hypothetical protein